VDPVDNFFEFFRETQEPPAIGRVEPPNLTKNIPDLMGSIPSLTNNMMKFDEIVGRQPPLPPEPPFDE
jgi:hypothetical protein